MIYQYKCGSCYIEREVERSIHSEASNPVCECGSVMGRVWLSPALQFRGKGFYSTDK